MLTTLKLCKKNLLHNWVFLCVALYFLLLFTVPRGYGIGAILLALTALIVIPLLLWKKQTINFSKVDRNLLIMFAVYGLGLTLINIWHNNPIKEYEHGFKFLLAIPMFLLLYKYPIKPIWLFVLVIAYASIIQLFAFISLTGLILVKDITNTAVKWGYIIFAVTAFGVGMYVSVLSLSRGVWLAVPFQLLLVAFFYFKFYKKIVITVTLMLSLGLVALYLIPQTHIKSRIDNTFRSIVAYQKGKTGTNTGLRLELYKVSWLTAEDNPILGASQQERQEKVRQLIANKIVHPNTKYLKHFHSRYFEILAKYGMVGIALLLLLDLFIIIAFLHRLRASNIATQAAGAVGILMVFSYAIYGLTDGVYFINAGLLAYFIIICSFGGSVQQGTNNDRK